MSYKSSQFFYIILQSYNSIQINKLISIYTIFSAIILFFLILRNRYVNNLRKIAARKELWETYQLCYFKSWVIFKQMYIIMYTWKITFNVDWIQFKSWIYFKTWIYLMQTSHSIINFKKVTKNRFQTEQSSQKVTIENFNLAIKKTLFRHFTKLTFS